MKQEEFDFSDKDLFKKVEPEKIVGGFTQFTDPRIPEVLHPVVRPAVNKVLANLSEVLQQNFPDNVKERLKAAGEKVLDDELVDFRAELSPEAQESFGKKLVRKYEEIRKRQEEEWTVKSEIDIDIGEVWKYPLWYVGGKPGERLELTGEQYSKLSELCNKLIDRGVTIHTYYATYYCVEKGAVDTEEPGIKELLIKVSAKNVSLNLSGEEFVIIEDLRRKIEDFQRYTRIQAITIRTVVSKPGIGDMVWRIRIVLPEKIEPITYGAEQGLWESETEKVEGHLSFEESLQRLKECAEQEKTSEELAMAGLAMLFAD